MAHFLNMGGPIIACVAQTGQPANSNAARPGVAFEALGRRDWHGFLLIFHFGSDKLAHVPSIGDRDEMGF